MKSNYAKQKSKQTNSRANRLLLFSLVFLFIAPTLARAELKNGMAADVVIGQKDFNSGSSNPGGRAANTLNNPWQMHTDGMRLFIGDFTNNRVLIFNSIPNSNNVSADVVVGQSDFASGSANPGGRSARTLSNPVGMCTTGGKLLIADYTNNRVLIYNSIPTTNNASADVVIGQTDFSSGTANQTGAANVKANTLYYPLDVFFDGKKLFIADELNSRVLIYNSIPTSNNAPADVVIGQADFNLRGINGGLGAGSCRANTLYFPAKVYSDGQKLFISDYYNNRILIYNSIPTSNNASADVVIGQPNFTSNSVNQTGSTTVAGPNTFQYPGSAFLLGKRLVVADNFNSRVLIFNSLPTQNNASADIVLGQSNFVSCATNQGGGPKANNFNLTSDVCSDGKRLFVCDYTNHRILVFNIGSSSIKQGPQFDQGKAVVGKVFNDINGNKIQEDKERGIEGVKVVSDTGIYAITDSDGKYHFPYIEVGQHLLKIDESTLPESSTITTDNPYKVTVTEGVLTKVSFGVKLPPERNNPITQQRNDANNEPLLKISVSQDPVMLKPRLSITAAKDNNNITFDITCNYYLFITKSRLTIYNQSYNKVKEISLPNPIPSTYTLPVKDLPPDQKVFYYQLSVYDKNDREDRTGIGSLEIRSR